MTRPLLILNPGAGAVRGRPTLLSTLQAHPVAAEAELALSQGAEETRALARRAREEGRDRILVAGGDGTIHHVVNGLMEGLAPDNLPSPQELPGLWVIPMGTGNDLARSLGIPLEPWDALDALEESREKPLDLIWAEGVGEHWCVNVITGGPASPGAADGEEQAKEGLGVLAYWRRGVEAMAEDHPSFELSLTLDDSEELNLRAQNMVLGNGRFVAGGIPVAPKARLDDGLLDLLVVSELDMAEMGLLIPRLLLGKHPEHDAILTRRIRRVSFRSNPELALSLDGERGQAKAGEFRVVEGALRVATIPDDEAEVEQWNEKA